MFGGTRGAQTWQSNNGGGESSGSSNATGHNKQSNNSRNNNNSNNNGLYTLNQMELKHELKRIELSRRQYEMAFEHEQRKLITRIANKLIHSNSNLDVIFKASSNRTYNNNRQQSVSHHNNQSGHHQQANQSSVESHRKAPPPFPLNRGITHIGFTSKQHPSSSGEYSSTSTSSATTNTTTPLLQRQLSSRPIMSVPPPPTAGSVMTNDTMTSMSDDRYPISRQKEAKKTVKWKSQDMGGADEAMSSSSGSAGPLSKARTISLYELNKKYDELRLKFPDREPKVLLPLLVSANRREPSTTLGSRQNSDLVADEHRRKIDACKKTFMKMVDSEDSGFYSYKDSNGQPVCLGYDNYGMLLDSSDSNRSRFRDLSATTTSHFNRRQFYRQQNASRSQLQRRQQNNNRQENSNLHHHFYQTNQFGLDDQLLSIEYERARKEKLASSRTTIKDNHHHHHQQQGEQTEAAVVVDPDLLRVKNEEENRMCNDTFKAQMIKSLTFKNVVTY